LQENPQAYFLNDDFGVIKKGQRIFRASEEGERAGVGKAETRDFGTMRLAAVAVGIFSVLIV